MLDVHAGIVLALYSGNDPCSLESLYHTETTIAVGYNVLHQLKRNIHAWQILQDRKKRYRVDG